MNNNLYDFDQLSELSGIPESVLSDKKVYAFAQDDDGSQLNTLFYKDLTGKTKQFFFREEFDGNGWNLKFDYIKDAEDDQEAKIDKVHSIFLKARTTLESLGHGWKAQA